ncbi:hypothetical protein GCM10009539_75130 [Cryptosporangium japonicum]|uniref:Uncharacterized protein n=1 Tax=Cryptosporangium japonicum TaxID=80872 RepID=A0ABP3EVA7_9ACTN
MLSGSCAKSPTGGVGQERVIADRQQGIVTPLSIGLEQERVQTQIPLRGLLEGFPKCGAVGTRERKMLRCQKASEQLVDEPNATLLREHQRAVKYGIDVRGRQLRCASERGGRFAGKKRGTNLRVHQVGKRPQAAADSFAAGALTDIGVEQIRSARIVRERSRALRGERQLERCLDCIWDGNAIR